VHSKARIATSAALGLAWLFVLAGPVRAAEDEIDSARSGPYIGVNAGAAIPNFDGEYFFTPPPFEARTDETTSLELLGRAGWRLLPYLAIEGQYEWVREWELTTKTTTCAEVDAEIITGNIRLFAPFEAIHPYAVVGAWAGRFRSRVIQRDFDVGGTNRCAKTPAVDLRESNWELAFRFGGGLDVYVTRHVIVNLEASTIYAEDEPFGQKFPFVSVSGGLGYRF
jgi:opacity protein-like surface antigen